MVRCEHCDSTSDLPISVEEASNLTMDTKENYGSIQPVFFFVGTGTNRRQRRQAGMWIVCFVLLVFAAVSTLLGILEVQSTSEMDSETEMLGPFLFSLLGRTTDERNNHQTSSNRNKTLLLLRHAQSSWDDATMDDYDRPLTRAGRRSALQLGKYLQTHCFAPPNLIYASPSLRTRETLALVRYDGWAANVSVVWDERLYNFDLDDNATTSTAYIDFVRHALGNQFHRVLIVGHNPPIGALQQLLVPRSQFVANFAPATFCELKWTNVKTWKHIKYGTGLLGALLQPKYFPWTK